MRLAVDIAVLVAALLAVTAGTQAARAGSGRVAQAWSLLTLGTASWTLGYLCAVYERSRGVPLAVTTIAALWALPLWIAGLMTLPAAPDGITGRLRTVLDGLLVACSLGFVAWALLMSPEAGSQFDAWERVFTLAPPAAGFVAVSLVLVLIVRSRGAAGAPIRPLILMAIAFVAITGSESALSFDVLQVGEGTSPLTNFGWVVGFCAIAASAFLADQSLDTKPNDRPSRGVGVLLPCSAVVVTLGLTVERELGGRLDAVLVWNLAALLALLVTRLVLTLLENHGLTRTLEQRVTQRTNELMAHESRFRSLVQFSSDVIAIVDLQGCVQYQSASVERVFGYLPSALVGTPFRRMLAEADIATFNSLLGQAVQQPFVPVVGEVGVWRSDGQLRPSEVTMTSLLPDPSVRGIVLNTRDIGDRRQLERELLHQAFHDPLTGLANRSLFRDRVEHALAQFSRRQRPLSVIFVDLDGFKSVNDSLGHAAGDALLVSVADRLLACVRHGDTVARLGGDEFAMLIEEVDGESEAVLLADRVLELLREPVVVDGNPVFVGGSLGIATTITGLETSGELLRNADLAMYRAKSSGKNSYQRYEPGMHSAVMQRMQREGDLRQAVEKGQFVLHYQPTVDLRTGRLAGVEALLRWWHPVEGIVPPSDFIPLAEETGLIVPMGEWALRESCLQGARWQLQYGANAYVGVNISGRQLQDPGLPAMIADALDQSGLQPHLLVLELTESMLMAESDELIETLRLIKALGVQLAIDDFGTGYSSLSYLHRFPVDILKVDRAFVARIQGRDDEDGLAATIVRLGQSLQLKIIAEGLEDFDQLSALQNMGCQYGQGFYFSRPYESRQIDVMLAAGGVFSLSPNSPRARKSGVVGTPAPVTSARPMGMVIPQVL
ncbi:MAG: EAL domain-containing protein [Mycobacteriales bacterium]